MLLRCHWFSGPGCCRGRLQTPHVQGLPKREPQVRASSNCTEAKGVPPQHHPSTLLPAGRSATPRCTAGSLQAAHPKGPGEALAPRGQPECFNQGRVAGLPQGPSSEHQPTLRPGSRRQSLGQGAARGPPAGGSPLAGHQGAKGGSTPGARLSRPPSRQPWPMARLKPRSTVPRLARATSSSASGRPPPAAVGSGPQPPSPPRSLQPVAQCAPPPGRRPAPLGCWPGWC